MRILLLLLALCTLSACAVREIGTFYPLAAHTSPRLPGSDLRRDIVLTIDGTGNSLTTRTNAGRLYELVDARAGLEGDRQIVTYYAEGVGSGDLKLAGLALGGGMSDDIKRAYAFLTRTWRPGDRIYLSGFSRGAYGVRALGGLLYTAGIPDLSGVSPEARWKIVDDLFDAYKTSQDRNERTPSFRQRRADRIAAVWREHDLANAGDGKAEERRGGYLHPGSAVAVRAMALWDTVEALGTPDGGEDPLEGPSQYLLTRCNVEHAFQALSLDDTRVYSFTPIFVDGPKMLDLCPAGGPSQRIAQSVREVWFAGAHADVGGAYEADRVIDGSLPNVSLNWMLARLEALPGTPLPAGNRFFEDQHSVIHDSQQDGASRIMYRQSRKPLMYTRHAFAGEPGDHLLVLHESALRRLEYLFALDDRDARCGGGGFLSGKPLLCARQVASYGIVPELAARGCLAASDWGYRVVPGPEGPCVEIEPDRGWTGAPPPLPECGSVRQQAPLVGHYFLGTPSSPQAMTVDLPLPRCVGPEPAAAG